MKKQKKISKNISFWHRNWVKVIFALLFSVIVILSLFLFYNLAYTNKIFIGVKIAGIDLGGKTKKEVHNLIEEKISKFSSELILVYSDQEIGLKKADIDLQFDIDKTVDNAFNSSRDDNLFINLKNQLNFIIFDNNLSVQYYLNEEKLDKFLENIGFEFEQPIEDANLLIEEDQVKFTISRFGREVDIYSLKENIKKSYASLSSQDIKITVIKMYPKIQSKDVLEARQEALQLISKPIVLKYKQEEWEISSADIASWINFVQKEKIIQKQETITQTYDIDVSINRARNAKKYELLRIYIPRTTLEVGIDQDKLKEYTNNLAEDSINISPKNASLGVSEGKVIVLASEKNGRSLQIDDTIFKINDCFKDSQEREIKASISEELAEVRTDNLKKLGLVELIGRGTSNFAGSPSNRIHNIKVGSNSCNGIMVEPGGVFSLAETLGEIEAETGYLPELVIKDNKTIPEYGGGLCQVATTCFRTAINSALPIYERSPHAYIVSYYAPTGTDASIYPPHPDVRFENDTGYYILVQTSVSGNILTFDFYGTKGVKSSKFSGTEDGEKVDKVESVSPHVWDQKSDGSAKAEFWYFVYENSEEISRKRFYSAYDSPDNYPH